MGKHAVVFYINPENIEIQHICDIKSHLNRSRQRQDDVYCLSASLHLSELVLIHLQRTLSVWLLWQLLPQMLDEAVFL